jgi:hypothetical protein
MWPDGSLLCSKGNATTPSTEPDDFSCLGLSKRSCPVQRYITCWLFTVSCQSFFQHFIRACLLNTFTTSLHYLFPVSSMPYMGTHDMYRNRCRRTITHIVETQRFCLVPSWSFKSNFGYFYVVLTRVLMILNTWYFYHTSVFFIMLQFVLHELISDLLHMRNWIQLLVYIADYSTQKLYI